MEETLYYTQEKKITQKMRTIRNVRIGLPSEALAESTRILNWILADTIMIQSLYKKHHWQLLDRQFYSMHLLFDKHYSEQSELVDMIAERIQLLGGVAEGMPSDVVANTSVQNPDTNAEDLTTQLNRLIEAHEVIIKKIRDGIEITERNRDFGTNDMLMGDFLRTNEFQSWFLSSHLK